MDRLSFTSVMDYRFTLLSFILFLLVACAELQLNGPVATSAVNAVSSAQNPFLTYQAPSGSNIAHQGNVLPTGNVANGQQRTDRAVFGAPPRCTQNCQDNTINPFLQSGVRNSDIEHTYQTYHYKLAPNSQPVPWASPQPTQRLASQSVPWAIPQPTQRPASQSVPWASSQPTRRSASQSVPWASPQPTQRPASQSVPWASPQPTQRPASQSVPWAIPQPTQRPASQSVPWAIPQPTQRPASQSVPWAIPQPTQKPASQPVPWAIPQPTQRPASQSVPWAIPQPTQKPASQPVPWAIPQPIPSPDPQPVPWSVIPQPTQRSIYQTWPVSSPQSGPGSFPQPVPGLSPQPVPGVTSEPTSTYTFQPAGQPGQPISNPSISTQPVKTALPLPSFNSIYSTTISKKKCREYNNELLRMASVKTQTETNSSVLKNTNEVCIPVNLITKGKKALQGEFPHMVALGIQTGNQFSLSCGGSLISSSWVLSAAHCTHDESTNPNMARLGVINLKSNQDGLMIGIKSFLRHPSYKPPENYGDIALVELQSAVSFSGTIRPACLYQGYGSVPNKAWVSGWGVTEYDGTNSDELQKALLTTVDNVQCSSHYINSLSVPRGITPSMICAGDPNNGWERDTCNGDSGGPFQIVHENYPCLFQIVGITSFGEGCGVPESPGVYIRVAYYLPWIEQHVWPQN